MTLKEILKFADRAVFNKTGKHLNDLQQDILEATLQGHQYDKIAEKHSYSVGYISTVASELWKCLSDNLGEKVTQSNIRATFQRVLVLSSNFSHNTITSCENGLSPPDISTQNTPNIQTSCIDLDDAPSPNLFYGRTPELNCLNQNIIKQKLRLIGIFGLAGIGKTSFTLQLIEQIKDNFDYIIYRNLQYFPDSHELLQELIDIFRTQENQEKETKVQIRTLIKYLKKYRCLLVFDNLQSLFIPHQLSGKYYTESQSYQTLFKSIAEVNHQSSVLVLSQEKPREFLEFESVNLPVLSLELTGLDSEAKAIFQNQGLDNEETWLKLIALYHGNPRWLHLISKMIVDMFNGKVTDVFIDDTIILTEELRDCLQQIYQRLTTSEQMILNILSKNNNLNLLQLKELIDLDQEELIDQLKSLEHRYLIETLENTYKINSVMSKFVISQK